MFKQLKLISFFLIIFSLNDISYANNIAFIDLDDVLQNSSLGKDIYKKLEEEKKNKLNDLKTKEIEIRNLEDELKNKKNIISNEDFDVELRKINNAIENFNNLKNKLEKEYDQSKQKEIINFFDQINPYIEKYLIENSIEILLNSKNVVIGKDNLDITKKIIKIIDDQIN